MRQRLRFAVAVGEPVLDDAIALEGSAATGSETAPAHGEESSAAISRGQQRGGLVLGTALLGVAIGALFGIAAAWAIGRVPR